MIYGSPPLDDWLVVEGEGITRDWMIEDTLYSVSIFDKGKNLKFPWWLKDPYKFVYDILSYYTTILDENS